MSLLSRKNNSIDNPSAKEFDLNIEKILENWEVYHAIREIIANALDEQQITKTKDIQIFNTGSEWHIRDFGRGLNYHHLTQNENIEKTNNSKLIGRFGIGLKDALATLYRHNVEIKIVSKFGTIMLKELSKADFSDIKTLHAVILPTEDSSMIGTDFILKGCCTEDISKAKSLFFIFSNETILETTSYGQVISKDSEYSNIYINGLKIAEESNFLFSYNITALNKQIIKALNRERTNVGRSAYGDRIKSILTACNNSYVLNTLISDLEKISLGTNHDEISWTDVSLYTTKKMSSKQKDITFISAQEAVEAPDLVDKIMTEGYKPVVLPNNIINKIDNYNRDAETDSKVNTILNFTENERKNKNIIPLRENELTSKELSIAYQTKKILSLIGGRPKNVQKIVLSEEIYTSELLSSTVGLWENDKNRIVIKRSQLESLSAYAGTLLHECIHALSGASDVSRQFEIELTSLIGDIAEKYLTNT